VNSVGVEVVGAAGIQGNARRDRDTCRDAADNSFGMDSLKTRGMWVTTTQMHNTGGEEERRGDSKEHEATRTWGDGFGEREKSERKQKPKSLTRMQSREVPGSWKRGGRDSGVWGGEWNGK
jgi:hypothetical protein